MRLSASKILPEHQPQTGPQTIETSVNNIFENLEEQDESSRTLETSERVVTLGTHGSIISLQHLAHTDRSGRQCSPSHFLRDHQNQLTDEENNFESRLQMLGEMPSTSSAGTNHGISKVYEQLSSQSTGPATTPFTAHLPNVVPQANLFVYSNGQSSNDE